MKIQCDVCNRQEASVFCNADEAALCDGCDWRVHHANLLASKHLRFSLLHPSSNHKPICDICQERRAFIFCKEDRAILCKECDVPIHTATNQTQKHSRFLLTGIKLSSITSCPYDTADDGSLSQSQSQSRSQEVVIMDKRAKKRKKKEVEPVPVPVHDQTSTTNVFAPQALETRSPLPSTNTLCASTISDYVIKTLPGWHVEDLLATLSPAVGGLFETDSLMSFGGSDQDRPNGYPGVVQEDHPVIWVPRVPQIDGPCYPAAVLDVQKGKQVEMGGPVQLQREWSEDVFAVPQISPPFKRSRPLWQIS